MPNYRRAFHPGGTFFFTLVTYRRARFLCDDLARALLRRAIDACRAVAPFEVHAFVLLPDHLHAIWTLPQGDAKWCCGCDPTPVPIPDFARLDTEGIEAAFGE
jgi:putative transposase